MNLLHILEVIFAFGFMIFIHEGGHYLACRLFGVDVDEFALGFGPKLTSRQWGKTLYSVRSIPLGGFCKPKGGDLSGQSAEEMYAKPPEPGEFLHASWWKRILIFLAGPGMNLVSAFAIIFLLFMFLGEPQSNEKAVLGFVIPGSLAAQAGLKQGDLVLQAAGKDVKGFEDFLNDLPEAGKSADLRVLRGGKTLDLRITDPPKPSDPKAAAPVWGLSDATPAVVGEAILGQPARDAGIRDGDKILEINGHQTSDWAQMAYFIRNAKSDPLDMVVGRGGETHRVSVHRVFNGDYMAVGISPPPEKGLTFKSVSIGKALSDSSGFILDRTVAILKGIGDLVLAKISIKDSVAGPITIMRMMYHRAAEKFQDFLTLVSGISLMLFIMNLLPIPVVDGGQIVLCLVEGVKRSPVSIKIQSAYQQVGLFLIVLLMGLAVFNDFKNLFLEAHNHFH